MNVTLKNLSVGYQGKVVVRGIDTVIGEGEITGLIGPNGAGKSTILKTVTGQIPALSGEILIGEKDLKTLSGKERARRIAVVLTDRPRLQLMTGLELVQQGRYPYTGQLGLLGKEDRRKAEEALQTVHAEYLSDRDFSTCSDGEKQKLLIARAICQEPEILVLDEPTLFLDIGRQLELLTILKELAGKGITVFLSVHELGLAARLTDKLICVGTGRIFAEGKPEEVLQPGRIRELYGIEGDLFDSYLKLFSAGDESQLLHQN